MMGHFNVKIGSDNRGYGEIMGQHELGEKNDNGERFPDLCVLSNLVIGRSVFQHKRIHGATWVSPDLSTENQIDHVCIGRMFRRSLQDILCEAWSRCCFRPPSPYCQPETQAEEELNKRQLPAPAV